MGRHLVQLALFFIPPLWAAVVSGLSVLGGDVQNVAMSIVGGAALISGIIAGIVGKRDGLINDASLAEYVIDGLNLPCM